MYWSKVIMYSQGHLGLICMVFISYGQGHVLIKGHIVGARSYKANGLFVTKCLTQKIVASIPLWGVDLRV